MLWNSSAGTAGGRAVAARASRAAGWRGQDRTAWLPDVAVGAMRAVAAGAHKRRRDVLNVLALGRPAAAVHPLTLPIFVRRGCGANPTRQPSCAGRCAEALLKH